MKKILLPLLLCFFINTHAQNVLWKAFDTNGPMGECLFPQNEEGDIVFTEVIKTNLSADTILGLAKEFIYDIKKKYKAECEIELEGVTKLACNVKLPVGKEYFVISNVYAGPVMAFERAQSEVIFDMVIVIREGKYRYTLNNFITKRRRIPGEGKNDGQSNVIHWQRVNSLTKETPKKGKEREEYLQMIEFEKASYQAEYNAVQNVIKGLRNMTELNDDI